jgi:hypothetical protein
MVVLGLGCLEAEDWMVGGGGMGMKRKYSVWVRVDRLGVKGV